jgi:hypothetical protein
MILYSIIPRKLQLLFALIPFANICILKNSQIWGCSSAGRAPEWHSGGQGFDPPQLHKIITVVFFGFNTKYEENFAPAKSAGKT